MKLQKRILTLGYTPDNAYSQYLKVSRIKEDIAVSGAQECLSGTLQGLKTLLDQQREILALAGDADDEGTASQMSDYIKEQEKIGMDVPSSLPNLPCLIGKFQL